MTFPQVSFVMYKRKLTKRNKLRVCCICIRSRLINTAATHSAKKRQECNISFHQRYLFTCIFCGEVDTLLFFLWFWKRATLQKVTRRRRWCHKRCVGLRKKSSCHSRELPKAEETNARWMWNALIIIMFHSCELWWCKLVSSVLNVLCRSNDHNIMFFGRRHFFYQFTTIYQVISNVIVIFSRQSMAWTNLLVE